MSNRKVHAGGSSTIDGVRYQMLWSLLRTTELRILSRTDDETGSNIAPILRLEPVGGGGDLQEVGANRVIIEQIKSRSTQNNKWSLRDIIDDVLPDLYRAIDENCSSISYRFVTEGERGKWENIYSFFRSIHTLDASESGILLALDNHKHLQFGRGKSKEPSSDSNDPYWRLPDYTQRTLFEHIVHILRKHNPAKNESVSETQRKLWHLLGNFEMEALRSMASLQSAIDDSLLAMGCPNTELDKYRRAMIAELEEVSTSDDNVINVQEFLNKYGLSIPITKWLLLRKSCTNTLRQHLNGCHYDIVRDVRPERAQGVVNACSGQTAITIISGATGSGKRWALYGAANLLAEQRLVVLIEATEDAGRDIEKASGIFCRDIWELHQPLSFNAISERLRREKKTSAQKWLTLCIEDVQNIKEAQQLASMDWEKWGVTLLVSCSNLVAHGLEAGSHSQVQHIRMEEFSQKELHNYLSKYVSADWPTMPVDIKEVIKHPQFADIYRRIVGNTSWNATFEYKFYAHCWQAIREQGAGVHFLDDVYLRRLASQIVNGKPYPWLGEQLLDAGFNDDIIVRLMRAGWLQTTIEGCFEVVSLRLLNWAVAEGLVAAYRTQQLDAADLCSIIQNIFHAGVVYSGQNFGYVPMNVLWLLVNLTPIPDEVINQAILAFEGNNWHSQRSLYQNLLPTLGERIVPALFRRLETLSPDDTALALELYESLAHFDGDTVAPATLELLKNAAPHIQRFGWRVLSKCPSAMALDVLWKVHCDIYANPLHYAKDYELEPGRMVYLAEQESRDALLACIPLRPEWLPTTVETADPATAPMHTLAHLATELEGHAEVWKRCKQKLFATVKSEDDYLLAWNVYLYRDKEYLSWLQQLIRRKNDFAAGSALKAMVRIDPDLTLQELADALVFRVGLNRIECFTHLFLLRPEESRLCILRHLQQTGDTWRVAEAYRNSEDYMDVSTLEMLLGALETLLDQVTDGEISKSAPLWNPLELLCNIHRLELLRCFVLRRGSTLESKLADWLSAQASKEYFTLQYDAAYALTVLARIGGEGYTRVINRMITSPSVYARYDALSLAHKHPDVETFQLLAQVSLQEGENNRCIAERLLAVLALVRCGQWQAFVLSIMKHGFVFPAEIESAPIVSRPLDDVTMAPVLKSLASSAPTVGAILAIGLGQHKEKIDDLCNLLESVPNDSETAQACIQAIGYLGDCGERAVRLLEVQLSAPKNYRSAWISLLRSGSDKATDVLLAHLRQAYDQDIAINLLHKPRVAVEVARLVREHLIKQAGEPQIGHRKFAELLVHLDDTPIGDVLHDDKIQNQVRHSATSSEGWIWYAGTKAAAINALSIADKQEAYEIALATLRDPNSRDRERYPKILVRLHEDQSTPDLFEQIKSEKNYAIQWAIGRALSGFNLEAMLVEKLHSSDVEERIAACRVAEWQIIENSLDLELQKCMDDEYSDVLNAASQALWRRRNVPMLTSLIQAYHQESDASFQSTLLDTILELGDPGNSSDRWPDWVHTLCKDMPYLLWIYVQSMLHKKRKELDDEASRNEFHSRNR